MLAKAYAEEESIEAAHKLVTSHLKLVAKIALRYKGYGLPVVELVAEGNIGLMQAVKKYNPDLGYRLSTYALWWIKASIQEYILKSWSLVKIGTTAAQKKLFFSLGKIKRKIRNIQDRNIEYSDYKQIASDLGVSEQEVINMDMRLEGNDLSLNQPYGSGDDKVELISIIPAKAPSIENVLANKEEHLNRKTLLLEAMNKLESRELDIFKARRLSFDPATLENLSVKYNISKERVRQIENRAFEKVQQYVLTHDYDSATN